MKRNYKQFKVASQQHLVEAGERSLSRAKIEISHDNGVVKMKIRKIDPSHIANLRS